MGIVGVVLLFTSVRPATGFALCWVLPARWTRLPWMHRVFGIEWFTNLPPRAPYAAQWLTRAGWVDKLEYLVCALVELRWLALVLGLCALGFVTFVGHPGSFGGAGARAVW